MLVGQSSGLSCHPLRMRADGGRSVLGVYVLLAVFCAVCSEGASIAAPGPPRGVADSGRERTFTPVAAAAGARSWEIGAVPELPWMRATRIHHKEVTGAGGRHMGVDGAGLAVGVGVVSPPSSGSSEGKLTIGPYLGVSGGRQGWGLTAEWMRYSTRTPKDAPFAGAPNHVDYVALLVSPELDADLNADSAVSISIGVGLVNAEVRGSTAGGRPSSESHIGAGPVIGVRAMRPLARRSSFSLYGIVRASFIEVEVGGETVPIGPSLLMVGVSYGLGLQGGNRRPAR